MGENSFPLIPVSLTHQTLFVWGVRGAVFKVKENSNYKIKQTNNHKRIKWLKDNETNEEIEFGRFLDLKGIYHKRQKGFLKPFHRIVDFYIPKKKIIIEIDGGYHSQEDILRKDKNKDRVWGNMGYRTIRIRNEEVTSGVFIEKIRILL